MATYSLPAIIDADNKTVDVSVTPATTWITIIAPSNKTTTPYSIIFSPPLLDFATIGLWNYSVLLTNNLEYSNSYPFSIEV